MAAQGSSPGLLMPGAANITHFFSSSDLHNSNKATLCSNYEPHCHCLVLPHTLTRGDIMGWLPVAAQRYLRKHQQSTTQHKSLVDPGTICTCSTHLTKPMSLAYSRKH